ncbi:MAG: metallophosphoesterase family protein [Chloroflexota bacterium]
MSGSTPERASGTRSVALVLVVFAATLLLLFGALNLTRRTDPAAAAASPTPSAQATEAAEATATQSESLAPTTPSPSTASPSASADTDAVLTGAGDIASCSSGADKKTAALVDAIPGTVFTAGDNAYENGSVKDYRECYDPAWGRVKDRTRPSAGNHDWQTNDLRGYLDYFGDAAAPDGKSWYSYDLGAWHVIVLDSNCSKVDGCGADSAQGRWLAADLKASSSLCTLAIWHHPRFSSGIHGNAKSVDPFWRALYAAGADLIVNGHDHDYERFAPQDPSGHEDRERGIREFVVGTGGAEQRPFVTSRANSELRSTGTFGIIRLDLHRASYDWQFIPTSGDFGDSGTGPCH